MDEIIIYYSSINFRDVMLASGKLAIDAACKGRINQASFPYHFFLIAINNCFIFFSMICRKFLLVLNFLVNWQVAVDV